MLYRFERGHGRFAWWPWPRKAALVGLLVIFVAILVLVASFVMGASADGYFSRFAILGSRFLSYLGCSLLLAGLADVLLSVLAYLLAGDSRRIKWRVSERICSASLGNPLQLSENDELPSVSCKPDGDGFAVVVSTSSSSTERVAGAAPFVSAALTGRFSSLAVVSVEQDPASRFVRFVLRDVASDRSLSFSSADQMRPSNPCRLAIQDGLDLDLTVARSILVCGRTRSGKTTSVISLLLQVLLAGPDDWGSSVTIIDGKGAELAAIGAETLDEDGTAHGILSAMNDFERTRLRRQKRLNDLSRETGEAVMWWDRRAGMRPSYLFIDEYLALRSILPSKESKDDPGYSLAEFDGSVRRIATMGASAGCFLIISVAQASVGAGGIPTIVLEACGTRLLFRPNINDGAFMWPRDALEVLPERSYSPGEAWFSCDDGDHANPSVVKFPQLDFPAYAELRRLLAEYDS